jgi:copper oxidase (laccase) domain-containing protein
VLSRLGNEFGTAPAGIVAAIGVGVGPCHYPVGPEVVRSLAAHGSEAAWHTDGRVDLAAWAAGRLRALGVGPGRVRVLPGCTACSERHHSFRRDGAAAGRQWSAVMLTDGAPPLHP